MKTPKKIRDRYVRHEHADPKRTPAREEAAERRLLTYTPDTDPGSTAFMLGLIFFLEPKQEREQEPFPSGEILVCD